MDGTEPGGPRPGQRLHLARALSKLGLASRGVAEGWIRAGRVRVNGRTATDPRLWVELGRDRITADPPGAPGVAPARDPARGHRYLALHKPRGYVTTRSDELDRATVYDLLPAAYRDGWLFPVGRLDRDSEGLLLFTDDGAFSDRLTDPAGHVDKIYRVRLDRLPREEDLERLRRGVELDGRRTLPAGCERERGAWVRVTLREGRNRQIRRVFHSLGYKVERLIRIAIGPVPLAGLGPGEARELTPGEREALGAG